MTATDNQFTLLGFVGGDAWARAHEDSRRKLRNLLAATAMASSHPGLRVIESFLNPNNPLENFALSLSTGDRIAIDRTTVTYTGPDQSRRVVIGGTPFKLASADVTPVIDDDGATLIDEDGNTLLVDVSPDLRSLEAPRISTTTGRYILHTTRRPLTILSGSGVEYVAGVDYTFGVNGLVFTHNPFDLFPDGYAVVVVGFTERGSMIGYAARATKLPCGSLGVTAFLRDSVTPTTMLHAIADVCGFLWLEKDDTVIDIIETPSGVTYEFEVAGRVCVDYPHTRHSIGEFVARACIIGNPVTLLSSKHGRDDAWYEQISVGTITAQSFIPPLPHEFEFPDADVAVTTGPALVDGRLMLTGGDASDTFWTWLHRQQPLHSGTLASLAGFTTVNETRLVNMPRTLLDYGGWGSWIIARVVGWADWTEDQRLGLTSFMDFNKPAGTVVLRVTTDTAGTYGVSVATVIGHASDLGDNFVTDDGNNVVFEP